MQFFVRRADGVVDGDGEQVSTCSGAMNAPSQAAKVWVIPRS